jgi:hypothetical protein
VRKGMVDSSDPLRLGLNYDFMHQYWRLANSYYAL